VEAGRAIAAIDAGSSVKGEERERAPSEWAVLKISAVTSGLYLPKECKVVGALPARLVIPRYGDLLFSRANTRELGATCLVDHDDPSLFLPDKLWRITPNPELTNAEYLRFLLAHSGFRKSLARTATGTSGSMLNIAQTKLLRLSLPMPPIAMQKRFAATVWSTYRLRNRIEEAGRCDGELFASVEQRAFRGEL
jgi:type I restriction enzyme S subunit